MKNATELYTIGTIAAEIGCAVHRVDYAIKSQGIHETARAGQYRLFNRQAVDRVRTFINANDDSNCPSLIATQDSPSKAVANPNHTEPGAETQREDD